MPELDRTALDARLEHAARTFADGARTEVDAAAVANRVASAPRTAGWSLLRREVPVPVALLLAAGLLLLLTLGTLTAGSRLTAPWTSVAPAVSPAAWPAGMLDPTRLPVWPDYARTDAAGPEPLSGSEAVALGAWSSFTVITAMNDTRVTGSGTWRPDDPINPDGPAAIVSGPFHLETAEGAWDGTCTGMATEGAHAIAADCWLVGSGAYHELTWYRQFTWRFADHWSYTGGIARGVIYPGQPPAR